MHVIADASRDKLGYPQTLMLRRLTTAITALSAFPGRKNGTHGSNGTNNRAKIMERVNFEPSLHRPWPGPQNKINKTVCPPIVFLLPLVKYSANPGNKKNQPDTYCAMQQPFRRPRYSTTMRSVHKRTVSSQHSNRPTERN